ncbi:hypothetical protein N7470_010137 [Penicillium chermesinum]|nr:hypothetical protein N7470_010137 [Penicillium chermesinum]
MSADEGEDVASMPHQKRKRVAQDEKSEAGSSTSQDRANLHETLRNLISLLLKHDTELKLLSCPFPISAAKPRTKRARTSNDPETTTIQARVEADHYGTLQEFLSDIERASAAVIEQSRNQSNGTQADGTPLTEMVNRIAAFKKHMNSLVGQSFVNQVDVKTEAEDDAEDISSAPSHVGSREDKQALTFFGGSQSNPKQLFSSLQKSVKVPLQSADSTVEKIVEVQEDLREGALPNGISTTRVVPYNLNSGPTSKRTFGEVFAPRSGLPKYEPPRKRLHQSTTDPWIDHFDLLLDPGNFSGGTNNYNLAPLPATQWLQYGGVTSSPAFWTRVEKHNAQPDIASRHADPALWTDEDTSLFQGVYSSFAPSYDSSGAIVQADERNAYPAQAEDEVDIAAIDNIDDSTLEEVIKDAKPRDYAEYLAEYESTEKEEKDIADREVDDVLAEISGLLETLSSYQKTRRINALFSGKESKEEQQDKEESESKQAPLPDFGEADKPSDAERAVYESLQSRLVALVSAVPPYIVAKVDGDQLGELNISQKIIIENPDWSGTMEKDDYTLHQERTAAIAAQTAAAANRASATPSASRPGNYQAPQSAYGQRNYTPNTRPTSGYQVPQGRQPASSVNFTPGYTGGRPPSTPQRPYNPQYSQANPQYSQANNVPQFQRPTPNGVSQQTPQGYTPRPGQTSFSATPQARTPQLPAGSTQRLPYANQTPSQGTPHIRTAAEQAALIDRNKAQLAAQQNRQSPSTPQPQSLDARRSAEVA